LFKNSTGSSLGALRELVAVAGILLSMLAFVQDLKKIVMCFIGMFNKTCSCFIRTVEQFDVFLFVFVWFAVFVIVSIPSIMKSQRCKYNWSGVLCRCCSGVNWTTLTMLLAS
jgi:hypothetical protein